MYGTVRQSSINAANELVYCFVYKRWVMLANIRMRVDSILTSFCVSWQRHVAKCNVQDSKYKERA